MVIKAIAIFVILIAVFTDALRDTMLNKISWMKWHVIKWISLYTPLVLILYMSNINFLWWIPLAILSWGIWRLTAVYIGKVNWESFWYKKFKELFIYFKSKIKK